MHPNFTTMTGQQCDIFSLCQTPTGSEHLWSNTTNEGELKNVKIKEQETKLNFSDLICHSADLHFGYVCTVLQTFGSLNCFWISGYVNCFVAIYWICFCYLLDMFLFSLVEHNWQKMKNAIQVSSSDI